METEFMQPKISQTPERTFFIGVRGPTLLCRTAVTKRR